MKNYFRQKGQSLIEAIVALVTILLIITAIAVVLVNSLFNSQFVKNQNEANKYAQQGIELVRNIQTNDLKKFQDTFCGSPGGCTNTTTWCFKSDGSLTTDTTICNGVNIPGTIYHRQVTFSQGTGSQCAVSELLVTVSVSWKSSKCQSGVFCHESRVASCMAFSYPRSQP